MDPETKSERRSFSLRPTVAAALKKVAPNMNDYLEELITADLLARGALTEEQLKDAIYGSRTPA